MRLFTLLCFATLAFAGPNHDRYKRHREAIKNKEKYPGAGAQPVTIPRNELPESFDWGDVDGKSYLTASWNQHQPKYCGSCYVHGTLSAVNDRLKVLRKGQGKDVMLARQVMLNCGRKYGFGNGCGGGESSDIYEFMRRYGLPDETCYNYLAEEQPCPDSGEGFCMNCMMFGGDTSDYRCWPVDTYVKWHVTEYGEVNGEEAIMSEVLARGPVTCGLVCPEEFVYGYKGGIYRYEGNETDVDHDVEIVGWGEENGVPYWNVRNSWGTYWGENGFFRIVRGENNLRIEELCTFALLENKEQIEQEEGKLRGSMFGVTRKGDSRSEWKYRAPDPKGPIPNKHPQSITEAAAVPAASTLATNDSPSWALFFFLFIITVVVIGMVYHLKRDKYEYHVIE